MLTYSCFRDLSRSDDPDILGAINDDLKDYLTALVNRKRDFFNELLEIGGCVSLGEVYNSFGLETTPIDRAIGWEIDFENRDCFIDLGYRVIERDDGSKRYVISPNVDRFILTTIE